MTRNPESYFAWRATLLTAAVVLGAVTGCGERTYAPPQAKPDRDEERKVVPPLTRPSTITWKLRRLREENKWDEAIRLASQEITTHPQDGELYAERGRCHSEKGDLG